MIRGLETKKFVMLLVLFGGFVSCSKADVTLTKDGKSEYTIFVGSSELENFAAKELQKYICGMSGAALPIVKDANVSTTIILTKNKKLCQAFLPLEQLKYGSDGFRIRVKDGDLIISAAHARGVLYGVYTLLEDHLGCRWYSSEVSMIPRNDSIVIGDMDEEQIPKVKFRDLFYYDLTDSNFCAKMKVNGNDSIKEPGNVQRKKIGIERHVGWGSWCHTIYSFVSPEYYKTHPEYFPLINGKRIEPDEKNGSTQVCFSNPDVLRITIDSLRKAMKKENAQVPIWAEKDNYYWSVCQMDGGGNCQCENCLKLDEYDGTPMGSIITFINAIAEEFPDKKIATLAYTYSRKAPKFTKLKPNVAIQLCAIETARAAINEPVATSDKHAQFRDDVVAWGKLCKDIQIWDYEIHGQNLVSPFPNFDVMQSNIRFYVANNAAGIFCYANRDKGGEFCELRAYVLSKLLWNPDCDVNAVMDDFLYGYYGPAGLPIRRYIDLEHEALKQSGKALSIDGELDAHKDGYLSEKMLAKYNRLFDEAELLVRNDKELLFRVRVARMPLMYAQLRLKYGTPQERQDVAKELFRLAEKTETWMFSEVDWADYQVGTREMFKNKLMKELQSEMNEKSPARN